MAYIIISCSSISYKFNTRNKDTQMSNKREELLKRIEETRKKLQSVSKNKFFVPLKTSMSGLPIFTSK